MSLVAILDSFDSYIAKLKVAQKVQLFLLPFLIVCFAIYHFELLKPQENSTRQNTILEKSSVDFFNFLKEFQALANSKDVQILKTQQNDDFIHLELSGKLKESLEMLYFCETYKSVNKFELLKLDIQSEDFATISLDMQFAKHNYDFKSIDFIKNNENKLQKIDEKKEVLRNSNNSHLKLNAIINSEAFINDIWIKKGDIIDGFIVQGIDEQSVELSKDKEILVLYLWSKEDEK